MPKRLIDNPISSAAPFLLFVQHGWADGNRAMLALGKSLISDGTPVIAPDLGYVQTWLRIAPLVQQVEALVLAQMAVYPDRTLRIVGHSMGGLIWLEVLNRNPDWWARVHSLVLIASPVGGADLGRLFDPMGWGIGIAKDLGTNRKAMAEKIAAQIPTLVIAGDIDQGSDGTVPVACTRFPHTQFFCLPLSHPDLRAHPTVAAAILDFWADFSIGESIMVHEVIQRLQHVPGITDGHRRNFSQAHVTIQLPDGGTVRTYKNLAGIDHVFVASPAGDCLYAGFVGWFHAQDLRQALVEISQETSSLDHISR